MNFDHLLRDYARQDLQRFCPAAHYWLREHNPTADRELTEPLLGEPMRFGLTPRERVAATSLGDLATYEITSRAIWDKANPARDSEDTTPTTGTTFDQEREIWGRREVFRRSAFVYARMLDDAQLIEHYRTPQPAPAPDTAPLAPVGNNAIEALAWKQLAQNKAHEIIAADGKRDWYPSQENIADRIAVQFREAVPQVVGGGGKPLTGAYIKRHALSGISSEQGKRRSTIPRRGK